MTDHLHKTHRKHTFTQGMMADAFREYLEVRGAQYGDGSIHMQVEMDPASLQIVKAVIYMPRQKTIARPTKKKNRRKQKQSSRSGEKS
jgi:hypothetical protein